MITKYMQIGLSIYVIMPKIPLKMSYPTEFSIFLKESPVCHLRNEAKRHATEVTIGTWVQHRQRTHDQRRLGAESRIESRVLALNRFDLLIGGGRFRHGGSRGRSHLIQSTWSGHLTTHGPRRRNTHGGYACHIWENRIRNRKIWILSKKCSKKKFKNEDTNASQ